MQKTDIELIAAAQQIRDESAPKINTAVRLGNLLDNLIDSKINNVQIDIDPTATANSDLKVMSQKASKAYADSLVIGLIDDRGSYNASVNTFPATGGSGSAGAIKKGDLWFISVGGTLGGVAVAVGSSIRALIDTPAQTSGNWARLDNGIGYTPENITNKSTSVTTDGASTTKYPCVKAVKDYVDGVSGVALKTLLINVSQGGSSNPFLNTTIATPNPFSGTLTLTRNSQGFYVLTNSLPEFINGKTECFIQNGINGTGIIGIAYNSPNSIWFVSRDFTGGAADNLIQAAQLKVVVYP